MRCTNLHFDGLTDETINQGADFDALEGVKAYDADGNEVAFSVEPDELDSCVVGEQTLVYKAMGKDNRLIPSMCIPKDSNGASLPLGCTLTLLKENRKITVLQADPPRFTMNDVTIPKNTTLDVLDGVSAVDDNGNPITDIDYSGTLDKEVSGDIASIDDGDERYPVKSLKVTLEPIQSGSGTPSPSNPRPISGHTEVVTIVSPTTDAEDGTTYTTTLGRTVYGGTLDVVSGELVVDRAMKAFGGSENWAKHALLDGVYYLNNAFSDAKASSGDAVANWLTNFNGNISNLSDGQFVIDTNGTRLAVCSTVASTAEEFKTYLSANNLAIAYKLATPQTYQLFPQTISLLHGNNNVWSDGEVTMVYSVELPTDGEVSYPLEGEYEITYSASDKCGNIGEAIRHITVQ